MQIFGKQMFCCFYDTALVLVLVDVLAVVSWFTLVKSVFVFL